MTSGALNHAQRAGALERSDRLAQMVIGDLERITAFEHRFARAQATEVVDFRWGYGLLQADFPRSHAHNRVVVTSPAPAAEILASADELLGGAGLTHRYVSFDDDALGAALASDFIGAGYEHDTLTTMIYAGGEPKAAQSDVRSVSLEVLRPALIRDWRLELPDATNDVLDQLAGRAALYSRAAEVNRLAVFDRDEIAARVDLYVDPVSHVAQTESLVTHPSFRGRGYGDALVREALHRGWSDGGVSFLVADAADWPREWYARLGYIHARYTHDFTRTS